MRCPDCGHENPAGSENCERCNYPLTSAPGDLASAGTPVARPTPAGESTPPPIPRPLPFRKRERPDAMSQQVLSLWLFVGGFCVLLMIYFAVNGFNKSNQQPTVAGSSEAQQKKADELRVKLARDSTDIESRVALANVLYDTGNWSEAIIHYRSVVAHDSSQVTALVDMGVCYYNLSDSDEAERLFRLALRRDPHQPVALFNLGIVSERREDYDAALKWYHAALQSAPPEEMKDPLIQAMTRLQQKTGKKAPPLPDGM
jgi:cytochrome c-type biogenesis protein CcmH/NrfG